MTDRNTSQAEIRERLGRLDGRMDGLERRVEKIDANVERLMMAAHMGRGVWWGATKLGGLLLLLFSALGWVWSHARDLAERWGQG